MRVLMLQFASPASGEILPTFSHNLGVLAALLKADGFSCRLCTLSGYKPDQLQAALERHDPQVVLVEIDLFNITAAHRTIADISRARKIPIVVCGQYATCRPGKAMSTPGVRALLLGEYDLPGLALMRALRDGKVEQPIAGVWTNTAAGLLRGPVAALTENLDSLPPPDRELFDYGRCVQSTRQACFKVGRGCPQWCAFCVNDWYMDIYHDKGTFVRRRSVENVLEEVHSVVMAYQAAAEVKFYDHCFATDAEWLRRFTQAYPRRCALPYRCFVPVTCVTPEVAQLLAASNCRSVSTHVGAGSRFIRDEVLSIHISNERVVEACQILRQSGLSLTVEVFVGSPYESEITVEETLVLLRRCQADRVISRVFYPAPGTRAAELCAENGWISGRGEDNYRTGHSVLDMPSLPAERIDMLASKLPSMVGQQSMLGRMLHRIIRPRHNPLR